jgi:hypothetical protein
MKLCPLIDRVRAELRARSDHTQCPQQIVASKAEVDGLAAHFDSRQVVGGRTAPMRPRWPLTLFNIPVVKPNGEPWIVEERIGQGVTPVTVIE